MQTLAALFTGGAPGPLEIILVLFVILLLFGAKRLPQLSRSLGRSLSEFKKGREEGAKLNAPDESGDEGDDETPAG
jgi:sec-independent protein translocase protein TatA